MAYLTKVLNPHESKSIITSVIESIQSSGLQFDFIAVRGMSGAIISAAISIALKKPIVLIRKEHDSSHGYSVEFADGVNEKGLKYVIIDDGIYTGKTILSIIQGLNKHRQHCVGVFLYNQPAIDNSIDFIKLMSFFEQELCHVKFDVFDICNQNTTSFNTGGKL